MADFESTIDRDENGNEFVDPVIKVDGWNEWSRHVLAELRRLNKCYNSLDSKMTKLQIYTSTEIAMLKVKSGIWGAIGGMIPVAIALIFVLIHYIDKK